MGIPLKIEPENLSDYLAVMSKAVFQAGLSWESIDKRWPAFVQAFNGFRPEFVANLSENQIDDLLKNPSLLANDKKIRATIHNAKILIELETEYGGIAKYLRSFENYSQLSDDLKTRFSYLGELNVYYFLFCAGEHVPPFKSWIKTIKGNHPRMKEMVELARKRELDAGSGDAINKMRLHKSKKPT